VPHDARRMVESVYDEDVAEHTPESLQRAADRASGEDAAMRCVASNNTVRFENGYRPNSAFAWGGDEYTPTRLGEPTIRLRLAKWESEILRPWFEAEEHSWEYSEVSIRTALCGPLASEDDSLIQACHAHMQEFGDLYGRQLLPLSARSDGTWQAVVSLVDGSVRRFIYDTQRGLMWE